MLPNTIKRAVSSATKHPRSGIFGWLMLAYMKRTNCYLEENAVKLCGLQSQHRVLEISFGPGVGLTAALKITKDGTGKVYGVDSSAYVLERACQNFEKFLCSGDLELHLGNVMSLPFREEMFDKIFHCNSYYYWPSIEYGALEMFRVMKPGGDVVTTLNLEYLRSMRSRGWMNQAKIDPLEYMTALENAGFSDVHIEYLKHGKLKYQTIFAAKCAK